jgi:hypothetical protein
MSARDHVRPASRCARTPPTVAAYARPMRGEPAHTGAPRPSQSTAGLVPPEDAVAVPAGAHSSRSCKANAWISIGRDAVVPSSAERAPVERRNVYVGVAGGCGGEQCRMTLSTCVRDADRSRPAPPKEISPGDQVANRRSPAPSAAMSSRSRNDTDAGPITYAQCRDAARSCAGRTSTLSTSVLHPVTQTAPGRGSQ